MADDRLQIALDLARQAGRLAQQMRDEGGGLEARIKGHLDLVTAADTAVETLVRDGIRQRDPGAAILGEEGGLQGDGQRTWIVDPIDGTTNFYRGTPNWAISIAHFDGTALTDGVIHAPDLGLTANASHGKGSQLNGAAIVFGDTLAEIPIVALGHSPRGCLPSYVQRIATLRDHDIEHRHYGSATICLLGVLAGWFDAFHEPGLNIWDAAAGLLLVEEAGGRVHHDAFADFLQGPSSVTAVNRALALRTEIWG